MKCASGIHTALYRASGGRIGSGMQGMPVLLLTTTGRRSGKSRTTPLLYVRDGDAFAVVASNGGSDYTPGWWLNLQSDPRAEVEIARSRSRVTARKASAEEHGRLWVTFTAGFPGYAKYATKTAREIPVVLLESR
jgi:deazaflavin-dependent oxidoreductase (nitroreductase family)